MEEEEEEEEEEEGATATPVLDEVEVKVALVVVELAEQAKVLVPVHQLLVQQAQAAAEEVLKDQIQPLRLRMQAAPVVQVLLLFVIFKMLYQQIQMPR